jgi:hypothetical protein
MTLLHTRPPTLAPNPITNSSDAIANQVFRRGIGIVSQYGNASDYIAQQVFRRGQERTPTVVAGTNIAVTRSGFGYSIATVGSPVFTGLNVTGAADFDSTLNVDGAATFVSTMDARGAISNSTGNVTVNDTLAISGDVAVATNKFTVAAATGNTVVAGTLDVTGAATLRGTISNPVGDVTIGDTLKVTGAADFDSTVNIDGNLTLVGRALAHTFPMCHASRAAALSIANATWTAVTLDTEALDTDGFFTAGTKVVTIPSGLGGKYFVIYQVVWAANATGVRYVAIAANDSTDTAAGVLDYRSQATAGAGDSTVQGGLYVVNIAATNTMSLKLYQSSTAALNITSAFIQLFRLGS